MNNVILALAILSTTAFLFVLVTTIYYVAVLRPRLLTVQQPAEDSPLLDDVRSIKHAINIQQEALQLLQDSFYRELQKVLQMQDKARDDVQNAINAARPDLSPLHNALKKLAMQTDEYSRTTDASIQALGNQVTQFRTQSNTAFQTNRQHMDSRYAQLQALIQHEVAGYPDITQLENAVKNLVQLTAARAEQLQGNVDRNTQKLIAHQAEAAQSIQQTVVDQATPPPDLSELTSGVDMLSQALVASRMMLLRMQQDVENQQTLTATRIRVMESRLVTSLGVMERLLESLNQEMQPREDILNAIRARLVDLNTDLKTVVARKDTIVQDRLTDIKGIGPVFSGKLREAGIHTFRQLARMTPGELEQVIDAPAWQSVDTIDWINQAKTLVSQRDKLRTKTS